MQRAEDSTFLFRFSFIDTGAAKGFVTHYWPKHPPLSPEITAVFRYLNLHQFHDCPEFDFDTCYYRTLAYVSRGDSPFDNNTESAHSAFNAHAAHFSRGIEQLLSANAAMEEVGMSFLPIDKPGVRITKEITGAVMSPISGVAAKGAAATVANTLSTARSASSPSSKLPDTFDVAISFAGTERASAEQLANLVRAAGFSVFYDDYYPEQLWGKNLSVFFDEIFRKRARYCVMFISKEYQERKWTSHEARSAQARALEEKGNEYILPVRVDNTELDGLLPTVGYVPISVGMEHVADMLVKKLSSAGDR